VIGVLFLLLLAAPQPLGLPLGAAMARVRSQLAAAGIVCKPVGQDALECPRAPQKVAGATGLRLEFSSQKLTRAVLNIDPGAQKWAAFHARYIELKRQLTEQYGEPKASLEYVDSYYVLADDQYRAIAEGKGEFTTTWRAGDLGAKLSLHGAKRQVRLILSFGPKEDVLH
jgi:hypothetical protein